MVHRQCRDRDFWLGCIGSGLVKSTAVCLCNTHKYMNGIAEHAIDYTTSVACNPILEELTMAPGTVWQFAAGSPLNSQNSSEKCRYFSNIRVKHLKSTVSIVETGYSLATSRAVLAYIWGVSFADISEGVRWSTPSNFQIFADWRWFRWWYTASTSLSVFPQDILLVQFVMSKSSLLTT